VAAHYNALAVASCEGDAPLLGHLAEPRTNGVVLVGPGIDYANSLPQIITRELVTNRLTLEPFVSVKRPSNAA
jgi:hypothetical protein